MESSFLDLSLRHSVMSILEGTHYIFEAAESKMDEARQLYREAEEACKAVNNLISVLNEHQLSKEAKVIQGLIKKLDFVLERRGDELSVATDKYLEMEAYLRNVISQIISEIGKCSYGPIIQKGSIKV